MNPEKLIKVFQATIKSVDESKKTVVAVVSTKKTDRDGDVIPPDSFKKRIKTYRDHPVFLSSHQYRSLQSQIGEALNVKITEDGLEATFQYYVGQGNPEADWAWLLAQKNIAAFSIGFIGWDYEWIREKNDAGIELITGRTFTEVELLEISQVVVPSNRGALQMSRGNQQIEAGVLELASKAFADGTLKELDSFCKCGTEKTRAILAEKNLCTDCKRSVSEADMKVITEKAKAIEAEAAAKAAADAEAKAADATLSGTRHYFDTVLGNGQKAPSSPNEIVSVVSDVFASVLK